jgi:translation initiation factor 6
MSAIKYIIRGSDYIGAFASVTDKYAFIGFGLTKSNEEVIEDTLKVKIVNTSMMGSDLIGIFSKANSKGILFPSMISNYEIDALKKLKLDFNIGILDTDLNAIGNNILLNDNIAFINPDYSIPNAKIIEDVFDVEVVRLSTGEFKTVGANNLLTNKGLIVNNDISDEDKDKVDSITGFNSIRSTANYGSLSVGLSAIANSKGIIAGEATTGFELERLRQGLDIED